MSMEPASSFPQRVQIETDKEDQTRYVEELAGQGDYWLSITDAARVCRVQDVSIRRAIARGTLPVRRQRAGQNKRTRFVRAGDLPDAGFPIIDESAVITTEIGKADILSIPRQQQRILQDHQQLLTQLAELQVALTGSQALLLADLAGQKEDVQAALHALQETQERQLVATETRLREQQEQLQQHLQALVNHVKQQQQQTTRGMMQLHEDITRQGDRLRAEIQELQAHFAVHQQTVQQVLADHEARQQQRVIAHQQEVQERFQQIEQEVKACLSALERRVGDALEQHAHVCTQRVTGLAEQLARLEQSSERLSQDVLGREHELEHLLEQHQQQLNRQARLLLLLPYTEKRLLTEQDEMAWGQALAVLDQRLSAEQQQHRAQYQPLLSLLTPARLEALEQLLDEWQARAVPPDRPSG